MNVSAFLQSLPFVYQIQKSYQSNDSSLTILTDSRCEFQCLLQNISEKLDSKKRKLNQNASVIKFEADETEFSLEIYLERSMKRKSTENNTAKYTLCFIICGSHYEIDHYLIERIVKPFSQDEGVEIPHIIIDFPFLRLICRCAPNVRKAVAVTKLTSALDSMLKMLSPPAHSCNQPVETKAADPLQFSHKESTERLQTTGNIDGSPACCLVTKKFSHFLEFFSAVHQCIDLCNPPSLGAYLTPAIFPVLGPGQYGSLKSDAQWLGSLRDGNSTQARESLAIALDKAANHACQAHVSVEQHSEALEDLRRLQHNLEVKKVDALEQIKLLKSREEKDERLSRQRNAEAMMMLSNFELEYLRVSEIEVILRALLPIKTESKIC
mmetsp:Transcript_32184/g.42437  ORF Transcript_32184/g.42437 Transcript_32184/m.42437 type:complete len:381 (+) Transcript_32184:60-1202(+)